MVAALLAAAGCAQILGIEDPVGDQCSPFDVSSCEESETCDIWEGEVLTCRPEGGLPVGAICDGAPDTCGGALSCVNGACRTLCDDQHGCGSGEFGCAVPISVTTSACDSDCNVLDGTGCLNDVDLMCVAVPVDNFIALCVPNGYFHNLPADSLCTFFEECERGYGCDLNGSGTCVPLCDFDSPACPSGTCTMVGRLHETLSLGVCSSG
jgi:hypothetical protein